MSESLTIALHRAKETKNTIRFEEAETENPMILGTLYLQKWALKRLGDPETITVTVAGPSDAS